MFKLSPNQAPTPTGCSRGASLGTLLESATEGRSRCSHLHPAACERFRKEIFFFSLFFFKHAWEAQQNSLGQVIRFFW